MYDQDEVSCYVIDHGRWINEDDELEEESSPDDQTIDLPIQQEIYDPTTS